MRILVTGGTGFVGQALVPALLAKNHAVTVLSRNAQSVSQRLGPDVSAASLELPQTLIGPWDAVINLAGAPIADRRWSPARKETLRTSRIELTQHLMTILRDQNAMPAVWINASAVGYYGDKGQEVVTEFTTPHEEFTHELCRDWEAAAFSARESGVRVCVARLGLVIGPGGFLKRLWLPFKLGLGGRLGDGKHWMPWVHRDDVVGSILRMLEDDTLNGPYNVVAPNPVTNSEFTSALGKRLGRPTLFPVPAFLLRLGLGEMATLLLTGQHALPKRLQEADYDFRYASLAEALSSVNF